MEEEPREWELLNPEQIQNWMERIGPEFKGIWEVVELIEQVLRMAPAIGVQMLILGGNPVYHALTASGRTSVTWSLFDERTGHPTGVYIRQIEPFDMTNDGEEDFDA